ncbi:MAG: beta-lactamase family protein [Cytophagales bacterium]|nr:beta-lactamase family protein [Rhizobacter sp.]
MSTPSPLPSAAPESVGFSSSRLEHLKLALNGEIERQKLPGAVLTITRRGKLVFFESLGKLDPAGGVPMTRDAIFRIYSMTKPIVSVALMMLVEQGKLLLTNPVAAYIPEFAALKVAVEKDGVTDNVPLERPITVHDLLRHTAGFTYQFMGVSDLHQQYATAGLFARGLSNPDFVKALAQIPLTRQPGTAWAYSHATDVVGHIVEIVSGKTLGAFLQDHIFGPLGMVDTAFHVPESQHHRIAEPFAKDPDAGVPISLFDVRTPFPHEMGGAGLASTAADYARFMEMMLCGGALGDVRIIGPKTVEQMTSDHLGTIPVSGELLLPGHGFGLGFAVRSQTGVVPVAGSAGMYYWAGLAGTSFFIDPKEQLHASLMIQQPGRRDYYRTLFRELVYAALVA